jgi:hypothetical protein
MFSINIYIYINKRVYMKYKVGRKKKLHQNLVFIDYRCLDNEWTYQRNRDNNNFSRIVDKIK